MLLNRRIVLSTIATLLLSSRAAAEAITRERVIALDWASAETLFSLGIQPLAITEKARFQSYFGDTLAAQEVLDLGPPWEPNLELIEILKPSLIYTSNYTHLIQSQLMKIAPTEVSDLHGGRRDQMQRCVDFAVKISRRLPSSATSDRLTSLVSGLKRTKDMLRSTDRRDAVCIYLHNNARFANVFGPGSFPGNVLEHVGLKNGWRGPSNDNGFAYVGVERLAALKGTRLYILGDGDVTRVTLRKLESSAIWNAIPAVQQQEVVLLPNIPMYGALSTAVKLSEQLVAGIKPDQNGRI
ncbi:hypothetical protein CQ052_19815 [Ochrobactrum sp. MYb15]|uniref:hypothetical protein n=1 Tax=Brucella pituitosa TaxID=571256 RepID=UPI000CFDB4D4|nr:hypothetical protein CQZ90_18210 [Ochrobactrum sp. MYb19]PRA63518.1 hypothetical protein CQ053_16740 [Ochrobactrum sp. MYb18]PRA73592.1 hypothetical protein CQ049_21320 [Brucella thiophenivorans]PRA86723.1 hypothetical protein CQ051_19725 [Ochrobactrum sp. MYb14]PRA94648.1 hypothetical protein CQ052_19815 [Ochrobactrum sp. MYb15]